ncbi:MAG: UDP-N-acetylglucosamine diphosphorylase [Clostridia bacterium]|nr:UDP-N-acetylglucosamine diphosphorylase [Clostridia bacterium]
MIIHYGMQQYVLDQSVKVGKNVTIQPYAVIKGNTVLCDGCTVGSFCCLNNAEIGQDAVLYSSTIENSVIGQNSVVNSSTVENSQIDSDTTVKLSHIENSVVGQKCSVGPYSHIRGNAVIGNNCRIGNFVEIKNSAIGNGAKASHLAYIGDATVGQNVNVGCGVIFVNYDGRTKHKTVVGDNSFIGCNSNLVAPVTVGDNCFIACGTTVTEDVDSNAFCIGRSKATVKQDGAKKYLNKKP